MIWGEGEGGVYKRLYDKWGYQIGLIRFRARCVDKRHALSI